MNRIRTIMAVAAAIFVTQIGTARASVYQWSVGLPAPATTQPANQMLPRAYLWIPPACTRVRAVVVGQHNMLEEDILDHPIFRDAMAKLGIAIIWISPSLDGPFNPEKSGDRFLKMLTDLASISGYSELAFAPVAPIGHSASASYPWNFAAWKPERTLGVLSIHGDAPDTPYAGFGKPNLPWGDRNVDGVPGFMAVGEFEWTDARWAPATTYRVAHPQAPIAFLAEPGSGHFNASDELVQFCAMFIRKCVEQRLPPIDGTPTDHAPALTLIDPHKGWLTQRWTPHEPHTIPPGTFDKYEGDAADAFWAFDQEMAETINNFHADRIGKKPQLLGFLQHDKPVNPKPSLGMVNLAFDPEDDGETFKLGTRFLDTVTSMGPDNDASHKNNLMRWSQLAVGSPIGHATGGGPIQLHRIEGPIEQTGPDTFRLSFNRGYTSREAIWLYASHPGDDQYGSAIQQAMMPVVRNTHGLDQKITFDAIADEKAGASPIQLKATSTANLPVHFYVREGPAEVDGNTLTLLPAPPRSAYPIKVTVVAWQWGRAADPKVKSAETVENSFNVTK